MRHLTIAGVLVSMLAVGACRSASPRAAPAALTGATILFTSLDSGKDDGSALTAQLLRNGNEVAAEVRSVGTKFDDHAPAPALAMAITGSLAKADAEGAVLRLRIVPEGRDTWTFNGRLNLNFADGAQQTYQWLNVSLDENQPERTLTLAGTRQAP